MKQIKSKIIRPHSKGCRAKGKPHEWSGLLKGSPYYGNFAANFATTKGKHYLWYVIYCNDPKCEGEKAVNSTVLANA